MFITYSDYIALYGSGLSSAEFNRIVYMAERIIDDATTGVDGIHKLDVAFPTREKDATAVKRCLCELVELIHDVESSESAQQIGVNGGGRVASVSSGSESISYGESRTAIANAVNNLNARSQLFASTVEKYLRGIQDANGVNLLFMGVYPHVPRHDNTL